MPGLLSHMRETTSSGRSPVPGVVASAAEVRQPHRIAKIPGRLASAYHRFYDSVRLLPRNAIHLTTLAGPRLWLADARPGPSLANGLGLLVLSAPDQL